MLNKILVPTDFSANSKAGIRFAMQFASQNASALVFYHCMELLKPMRWTDKQYEFYVNKHLESTRVHLAKFVGLVAEQAGMVNLGFESVVEQGSDPQSMIINYAATINADAICMGTRGAGKIKKIIGTNSSGILSKSPIPVFVIPKSYRRSPITNILYASDLDHVQTELNTVADFAKPLKANVFVYHYTEKEGEPQAVKRVSSLTQKPGVIFSIQEFDKRQPFSFHLGNDIRKTKASVAVLFTNQKRGWFDRLFQASRSAEASFNTKVPLLVFAKQ